MCDIVSICNPNKFIDLIKSKLYNLVIAGAEGSKAIIEKENRNCRRQLRDLDKELRL
jgi:hypothetical protein